MTWTYHLLDDNIHNSSGLVNTNIGYLSQLLYLEVFPHHLTFVDDLAWRFLDHAFLLHEHGWYELELLADIIHIIFSLTHYKLAKDGYVYQNVPLIVA